MKKLLGFVLAFAFLSNLLAQDDFISIANLARKVEGLNIGDKAPDFIGTDAITGANIQLNRFRNNNNVLLMFYSNALYAASEGADAPLRQGASDQIAQLIEGMMNSADPKSKTLKIILVTGDTQEQIRALVNQNPNLTKTMNIIRDEGNRIMDKYNSSFKINKNHPEVKELVSRGLLKVNPKDEYVTGVVPIMYLINREGRIIAQFSALNFERLQEAGVDPTKSVAFSLNYITSKITEW
ncbi:MAG: peroxiredoxin family protein [Bacteroidia bacterium]|nr:peroxiredoxin family protein [Bacteroidia bacterium]